MSLSRWRFLVVLCLLALSAGCPSGNSAADRESSQFPTKAAKDDTASRRMERPTAPPDPSTSLRARKRATTKRAGGVRDISFDDLEFPIERDADFAPDMLTEEIRELEGKTVLLRGYILASTIFKQTGIEEFVLVRDNQECCFGPGAYLYHNAQIEMVPPRTATFSIRPVTVRGVLSIRPWEADGKTYSVFHVAAEQVQ